MQAGKLRHRIELHSASESQNSFGEIEKTYSSYDTVWGSIESLTGRELEHAQQISAETTLKVNIRYYSGVETGHRVIYGSRTLEITHIINPDERNIELILYCKEIT